MIQPKNIIFIAILKRAFERQTLVICFGAAFVAALAGPFGTYQDIDTFGNLILWFLLIYLVTICIYLAFAIVSVILGRSNGMLFNLLFICIGAIAGAGMLEALLTWVLNHYPPNRPTWWMLIGYVGAIMLAILAVRLSVPAFNTSFYDDWLKNPESGSVPLGSHEPEAAPHVTCRLAKRLSLPDGAHVLKVSADGHFVEVKTCSQDLRTRLRFSDAVTELDGLDGVVTHRSHWVAKIAIRGWVPDASKPFVVLHDLTRVPVSRTYRADVDALGLPGIRCVPPRSTGPGS